MSEQFSVKLKVGGALVRYLPEGGGGSTRSVTCNYPTTVQDVLDLWQIPKDQPLMVIVNDAMISRPDYASTLLANADVLSLMPPITAG